MNAAADAFMGIFGMKRVKQKRCKHKPCREFFTPQNPLDSYCSWVCGSLAKKARKLKDIKAHEAQLRKETRSKLEALKSLSEIANDVQTVFNAYIRFRDLSAGHGCISCGTKARVQYAAGHYRSRGASGALRFNEDNVFLQCNKNCNSARGGNSVEMRKGMVKRIGLERVEAVENCNETKKYTREELYALKALYRAKLKELQKEAA